MSLTTGRGPLSGRAAGRFNVAIPAGLVYAEPFPRRVRGVSGDRCVIDSQRVVLVHRAGRPPTYAFPATDVHDVVEEAVEAEPAVDGYVSVRWEAIEAWFEEDEQVFGHPRNPYHRIDCVPTSRHLRVVEAAGTVLVDSSATLVLYETALEPRLYVEQASVRMDLLVPSDTTTYCPYKGTASYWTAWVGAVEIVDVAWTYVDPLPESERIRGLLSFDPARVTITDDLPRPVF